MDTAIQIFAILNLGIIGLSHLIRPKAWIQFFILLREKGEAGVFAIGFLSLLFGSLIVSFHNIWTGIPAVLTVLGWAQILKALIYFTLPAVGLRNLHGLSPEKERHFQIAGVLLLALASLLVFHLWVSG
ncbi:MAG: hypothetical protein K0U98_03065 [Deltaproteobacteria bacterium]|nr:hypothetical protein [Deltaproteobacteria bacterium]